MAEVNYNPFLSELYHKIKNNVHFLILENTLDEKLTSECCRVGYIEIHIDLQVIIS